MTLLGSLYKNRTFFFFILGVTFVAFAGDILDVRDEIHLLSCPYDNLDNNVTTGIQSSFAFEQKPVLAYFSLAKGASVPISFPITLAFHLRAPPA
jgi:hypothetical protein